MTAPSYRIAVIPGDGIGMEVVPRGSGPVVAGAIEDVLAAGPDEAPLTPGLRGRGSTLEPGQAIAARVSATR